MHSAPRPRLRAGRSESLRTVGDNSYQTLLQGSGNLLGRYGEAVGSGLPGTAANNGYTWLTWNRWFGYAENYWTGVTSGAPLDAWGSPPDTQGFGAIGLDLAGRPLYISMGGTLKNTPYDIDLSYFHRTPRDR